MAARRLGKAFLFLGFSLSVACDDQELITTGIVHPTLVEVSPADFLGDVPCQTGPGSAEVYVATLHDYGPAPVDEGAGGEAGAAGAASAPTGCAAIRGKPLGVPRRSMPVECGTTVGFARVTPDHCYSVDIEAFDRADVVVQDPEDAVDAGEPPPPVTDPVTGETVPPRWTTTCGKATARAAVVRRIRECEPLVDHQPGSTTAVEIRPDLALGSAKCGAGAGEVDHFELSTGDAVDTLGCGDPLVLDTTPAARTLVISALAFSAGDSAAMLGATCTAEVHAGVTVTATCLPFSDKGALEIDPRAAASALGVDCGALRELTLTTAGAAPLRVRPPQCGSLVPFFGLARGDQNVAVVATPRDGSASVTGRCTGSVVPGQRVLATCGAEP